MIFVILTIWQYHNSGITYWLLKLNFWISPSLECDVMLRCSHSLSSFLVIALISASCIHNTVLIEKKMTADVWDEMWVFSIDLGDLGSCWLVNSAAQLTGTVMLSYINRSSASEQKPWNLHNETGRLPLSMQAILTHNLGKQVLNSVF